MRGSRSGSVSSSGDCCSKLFTAIDILKYVTSSLVTLLCCYVVFHGIAYDYNVADFGGPVSECVIFLVCIVLLAVNEGFQVGVLNSRSMSAIFIRDEGYSRAANVHEVMFGTPGNWVTGNLKRLLIGQSFMVVLLSFTLAQLTTFPHFPNVYGLNSQVFNMLVCSGLPGVVITVVIAQLTPSLLAKEYPLGFLNIPGIYHIVLVALYLEMSGITHFVYVLYGMINSLAFKESEGVSGEDDDATATGGASGDASGGSSASGVLTTYKAKSSDKFSVPSLADLESFRGMNVGISVTVDESVELNSNSEGKSEATRDSGAVSSMSLSTVDKPLVSEKHDWDMNHPGIHVHTHAAAKTSAFVTTMPSLNRKAEVLSCCNTVILYLKYALSTVLTLVCFGFLIYGLAMEYSLISLPLPLQLLLLFLSMVVIIYCEGMKVSIVSTTHIDSEEMKDTHETAYKVHKLLNCDTAEGVKKFLLGRQLLVVSLGFFIASLTHFAGLKDHVPYGLYFVVVTAAFPGVMVFLEIAQLTPQLLAEQNNIAFINLPGSYVLARFLLIVESCGIMNVTWLIYYGLEKILCWSPRNRSEDYDELDTSAGNLFTLCYDSDSADASVASSQIDERGMSKIRRNPLRQESFGIEC